MDYTRWTELPLNPPPPSPLDPYTSSYSSHFPYYPSHHHHRHHHQNPNPSPNLEPGLRPPGVDSYSSLSSSSYPHSHLGYNYEGHSGHHEMVDSGSVAVPSGYYLDPNAQNWAPKEAVQQYGVDTIAFAAAGVTIAANGTEQLTTANPNPILWTNPTVQPHGNGTWKKHPKKTKIVQSAYCEVCKIDCNSKDVLDQHKLGKKHKKNLEKLKEVIAPVPSASAGSNNPVIGPEENPDKSKNVGGQKSKKKAAEPVEDLNNKRRKIVEGGAAAEAVRVCAICNVVCNSETVFNYHIGGRKHAAMVKKYAAGPGVATAT